MGSIGLSRVCHPSILRLGVWPEAMRAQSSMGTVSEQGSTVWVLMRRRNSSFSRSMALVVRAAFHCAGSSRVKVKSRSPFRWLTRPHWRPRSPFTYQAIGDRLACQRPLARGKARRRLATSCAGRRWSAVASGCSDRRPSGSNRWRRDGRPNLTGDRLAALTLLWRCQPPVGWFWFHPEITSLSNFHQLRDTTCRNSGLFRVVRHGSAGFRTPLRFSFPLRWSGRAPPATHPRHSSFRPSGKRVPVTAPGCPRIAYRLSATEPRVEMGCQPVVSGARAS